MKSLFIWLIISILSRIIVLWMVITWIVSWAVVNFSEPAHVAGGGVTGENLSFDAPSDSAAAAALVALSAMPTDVTYRIDWIKRTPGR